ncbi:probable palmitoyltransferase ZDHHC24 [Drosophila subpulchrella]|uniref:probable palmitoyltransferase ZDHHC24 n=1 Tax=Drosophila subpulchrella TaxID=1486046 RepID=UPI0018A1960C|nr:probable palmitoyltransferase ZDHHC24 [Drosophila subpulchrella]
MRFRSLKRIFWKEEALLTVVLVVGITIAYYVLMNIVLPELLNIGSPGYIFLRMLGLFLFSNIMSNMAMCMLVDPTVDPKQLSLQFELRKQRTDWHECRKCEILAPPRSYHCRICGVCILTRDHHCYFSACCIGYENYRYFFYTVLYTFVASFISFIASSIFWFVLHGGSYEFFETHLIWKEFVIPVARIEFICLYILMLVVLVVSAMELHTCWPNVRYGATYFEANSRNFSYDQGMKSNLEMFFGQRMHLTWISAFIPSHLPHDGINWRKTDACKGDWAIQKTK